MTISTAALLFILSILFGQCGTLAVDQPSPGNQYPRPGWEEHHRPCPEGWNGGRNQDGEWECRLEEWPEAMPGAAEARGGCFIEWSAGKLLFEGTGYLDGEPECHLVPPHPPKEPGTGFSGWEYSAPPDGPETGEDQREAVK